MELLDCLEFLIEMIADVFLKVRLLKDELLSLTLLFSEVVSERHWGRELLIEAVICST